MRKFILIAMACLMAASCGSPKILLNTNRDGVRTVLTGGKHLFKDIDVALGVRIEKRDTVLGIIIRNNEESNHGLFDKGDKLLFKLTDGSIVEFTNIYDKEYNKEVKTETHSTAIRNPEYFYSPWSGAVYVSPWMTTTFIPTTTTTTTTSSYALYLATKQQIQSIILKGVTKVRVEDERGYQDLDGAYNVSNTFHVLACHLIEGIADDPKDNKSF